MNLLPIAENNLTPEQQAENRRNLIRSRLRNLTHQGYQQLIQLQNEGMEFIWQNRQGLSPQEVANIIGTDAVKAMRMHGIITNAILAAAALEGVKPKLIWPSRKWTENPDGTITILDQVYEIPQ